MTSVNTSRMQVGGLELTINRKAIKNLHISVLPPDGAVRVSAPAHLSDNAIRRAIVQRIPWIRQQQRSFARQPRQSEREMVSGESHYFFGRRFRLEVIERRGRHEVRQSKSKLQLLVNPGTSQEGRLQVLDTWYRAELKSAIGELIPYWLDKIGLGECEWRIKRMKTMWGSCNATARRIWLNLELAQKPPECLEYILVHELVHLLERHHNDRFKLLMDKYLPDWRERRELLNRSPLANASWRY
ncbi:M48 family metallopeptidase [Microbulbifer agarilyticus]|uniref:M48 family metallopeptidase n=1 Tax=Microbulbifer agarilyticus TaxID=260552 RepID=UPI001C93C2BB|nr:SprT family zinc-dependent metalloprotease [Microbulbifer agarilyticus]MBY6212362.1 M48 family metallopeptidase [Microbulbifer agarilyticus]